MEYLEWMHMRFGNISRFTMGMIGVMNRNMNVFLHICDDVYGNKFYHLLDVMSVVKVLNAKLYLLCMCILFIRSRKALIDQTGKRSTLKKRKRVSHATPKHTVRKGIASKGGERNADCEHSARYGL